MTSMSAAKKRESNMIQMIRWAINRGLNSVSLVATSEFGGGKSSGGPESSEKNMLPGKHKTAKTYLGLMIFFCACLSSSITFRPRPFEQHAALCATFALYILYTAGQLTELLAFLTIYIKAISYAKCSEELRSITSYR